MIISDNNEFSPFSFILFSLLSNYDFVLISREAKLINTFFIQIERIERSV